MLNQLLVINLLSLIISSMQLLPFHIAARLIFTLAKIINLSGTQGQDTLLSKR